MLEGVLDERIGGVKRHERELLRARQVRPELAVFYVDVICSKLSVVCIDLIQR